MDVANCETIVRRDGFDPSAYGCLVESRHLCVLCGEMYHIGIDYAKNMAAMAKAAMAPARSAMRQHATACLVFLIETLPKYTART